MNCSTIQVQISDCGGNRAYMTPGDDPLQVTQEGASSTGALLLYGPWIRSDQGTSAHANLFEGQNTIPGTTISFSAGHTINSAGVIDVSINAPLSTPVGAYDLPVVVSDAASGVTLVAHVAVEVLACVPNDRANVCANGGCGTKTLGCAMTTDCGSCASGSTCSNGYCVSTAPPPPPPPPPPCPTGKILCDATGTCITPSACQRATSGP
jgi:hypothetical protein